MKNISPLEPLATHPLPELAVALLRDVHTAATATAIPWFVGGASARDILLTHVYGINPARATADIDIGISIESWTGHEELKTALVASSHFEQRGKATHRLHYRAPGTGEQMWLDVVPFGGVQDEGGEIAWPPDQSVRMNVAGFAQALDAAVPVRFSADLVIPVASLPSQAMLKIIAWQDRHATDRKDAIDLLFLLASYSDAGNLDRLYGHAFDRIEQHHYDPVIAGAALLGMDMADVATSEVRDQILPVLAPDDPSPRILEHMLGYRARIFEGDTPATIERLFNAFRAGFLGGIQRAGRA